MATNRPAVIAAATASAAMIAFQVAGKATRDALFLSSFPVTRLPLMVMASAVVSLLVVLWAVRRMSRHGPWRFIPGLFAVSVVLLMLEWALLSRARTAAAVVVYVHFTVLGALLISGFWSMVNERFDPRTAKRQIGRIGAAGTVGGLAGGFLAERIAVLSSVDYMLPALALLHLVATIGVHALRRTRPARPAPTVAQPPASISDGLRMVGSNSYLRNLTVLVVLCTVSEGLLDFVFKGRAISAYGNGDHLLRVFAAFYTGVALLTFLVQSGVGRLVLEQFGLAGAVGTLPAAVGVTGIGALLVPGFPSAAVARGTEAVLHNSLFRSGYELLFTPLQRAEKRATKTMIDVGAVRIGDIVGGALVQVTLMLFAARAIPALLAMAVALAAGSLLVTRRLRAGYRHTLEKSLVAHGVDEDFNLASETFEHSTVFETLSTIDLSHMTGAETISRDSIPVEIPPEAPPVRPQLETADAMVQRINDLRSGDRARVRTALESGPLTTELVPHVIPLLAWDDVARTVADALRGIAPSIVGQLLDAMLNPDEEFSIRRRIPGILISAPSERTIDGLLHGLADRRFEVRYRTGRALAELQQRTELRVSTERVFAAVEREVAVDRNIWESQRLLGGLEDASEAPLLDEFLRERAGRSMEHVFTMLSLVLPTAPLKIAYRGLYTDDDLLRGTALEYLENALPERIRFRLWPFLEDRRPRGHVARDRDEIIADLLRSNQSIALNLEELRKKVRNPEDDS